MVDIMDMEDIFYKVLRNSLIKKTPARLIAIKIREEVADFVEGQQEIKCNNCEYSYEESYSETRRIMMEDRD